MAPTLEFPHIFSPIFMHSFIICWVYMGLFEAAFVEGISIRRKFQDKWEARQHILLRKTLTLGGERKCEGSARNVSTADWMLPPKTKGFPGSSAVKESAHNAGDMRDVGLIPGSGRSSGGGHGNPLQYSCLENPMVRATWWATVHVVAKSQT